MKPLTSSQRERLYRWLVFGRARAIAKPLYDLLIDVLVGVHRVSDFFSSRDESDLSEITIVIKTFNRPYAIERLMKSICRLYPKVRVVIADDGRIPVNVDGAEVLRLPFDVGISVGRNRALAEVSTKFFLLLDDDFLFSKRQNLSELVQYMMAHPEVDIAGGQCIDLPLYVEHRFDESPVFECGRPPKLPLGTQLGDGVVVDKVQNYFIGRTESVRNLGWNDAYKVQEHTEFFTRARGRLVTVFFRKMRILHIKYPFDIGYLTYRWRTPARDRS